MNVLLIGSGGREHALAWKIAQSPKLTQLYTMPGNPGTAGLGINLPGDLEDLQSVVAIALQKKIGLVVVGPEVPLAAGLADMLREASIRVYGPSQRASQIEADKAFAKDFMGRHQRPPGSFRLGTRPHSPGSHGVSPLETLSGSKPHPSGLRCRPGRKDSRSPARLYCTGRLDAFIDNELFESLSNAGDQPAPGLARHFSGHTCYRARLRCISARRDRTYLRDGHFVPDEGVDDGPVIIQETVPIYPADTLEELEERIHAVDHSLLIIALR